jgi:putative spermidine/putrescine transport system ATP-binding protein
VTSTAAPAIQVKQATKSYGPLTVLDDVSVEIGDGEFFTLLGPSGSGKSTLLRIIAGLLEADSGEVIIGGHSMTGRPAHTRELGVVFQSLALFPHLSVGDNVAFPLRMRRVGRKKIDQKVSDALDLVQLPNLQQRAVSELSGGQSQRVALARAPVYEPRILLLDEPLSALDRRLRESMQLELTRIHRELGVTIVNVTHDQREALMVSDRIAVMDGGRIVQCGPGSELYADPATTFVAGFLGDPLLLEGDIVATPGTTDGARTLRSLGITMAVQPEVPLGKGVAVIRPERMRLFGADRPCPRYDNTLPGEVLHSAFDGQGTFYQVRLDCGPTAAVLVPAGANIAPHDIGTRVLLAWNAVDVPIVTQG